MRLVKETLFILPGRSADPQSGRVSVRWVRLMWVMSLQEYLSYF